MSINKEILLTAAEVVLHKTSLTDGELPDFLRKLSDSDAELMHDFITQMRSDGDAKTFEGLRKLSPEQIAQSLT